MKILRKIAMISCFLLYAIGSIIGASAQDESAADVYVIRLHGEVTDAMASYLERELKIAEENGQSVIIDIDTNGGQVISAQKITNTILNASVETTAYVSGKAISAGVILTISCDNVAMKPSAYIGAAEVIPYTEKGLSAWKGMLSTAAQERSRPEDVILAMADKRIVIDEYSQEGELLSLSSNDSVKLGVADVLCDNISEVMEYFELGQTYEIAEYTTADKFAAFLTSSIVLSILYTLGFAFLILEIFTAGFGAAGITAILCFALYFFGGTLAGTTQWWAIALFIMGIMALVIEMFVPGFGIFGISGLILCLLGLIFSSDTIQEFTKNTTIAIIVCAGLIIILVLLKKFTKFELYDKFVNKEEQKASEGYVINKYDEDIIGKEVLVVTDLRPIGIVELDEKRMDAFSDEGFIPKGETVVVTGKKSSSVVVRKKRI